MINVIKNILFDCEYENITQTEVKFEDAVYHLNIFNNKKIENQVFIILQILESQLVSLRHTDFVIEIVDSFRKSNIYSSDMDKNTSLVYCVETDINSEKLDKLKLIIEEDPFYFKKYVFTYSEADATEFKKLCRQYEQSASKFVKEYILSTSNYKNFKKNYDNEKIYRLVSELLIKIPVIPINFKTQTEIKGVHNYMKEIQQCNNDEIARLDSIIEILNNSEENIGKLDLADEILKAWGIVDLEEIYE